MEACRQLRAFIATGMLCAFFIALALAGAPQVHARFHADADSPNHECAVTLIAAGKCQPCDAPVVVQVPQPVVLFEKLSSLTPIDRAAPLLCAAIFEHAPPVSA